MSDLKIGERRVYDGACLPVIYPGEVAHAQVGLTEAMLESALRAQQPLRLAVTGWLVEPAPGWYARWLRTRYRIWGRWFARGPARLTVSATAPVDPRQVN